VSGTSVVTDSLCLRLVAGKTQCPRKRVQHLKKRLKVAFFKTYYNLRIILDTAVSSACNY